MIGGAIDDGVVVVDRCTVTIETPAFSSSSALNIARIFCVVMNAFIGDAHSVMSVNLWYLKLENNHTIVKSFQEKSADDRC